MTSEERIFQIKDYCLRNVPIRILWHKRMRELNAEYVPEVLLELDATSLSPVELIRWHEYFQADLKMRLSRAKNELDLIDCMESMLQAQECYETNLLRHFDHFEPINVDVKVGEWLSAGMMIKEMEFLENTSHSTPVLNRELARIKKRLSLSYGPNSASL